MSCWVIYYMNQSTFQVKVQVMASVRQPKAARQGSLAAPCRAQQHRKGLVLVRFYSYPRDSEGLGYG